ncbi:unnamed protein product [Eruca vesicaria subsp. sativa]|uniref:Uncharacterized protein n=1 Tax=Eruca vesicaria subsp. sativa TaxID=29727 RepID=A0ABC8K897_ERUVS|nr:unnamed protein product [Eruca vesicaria subsp. sativa]
MYAKRGSGQAWMQPLIAGGYPESALVIFGTRSVTRAEHCADAEVIYKFLETHALSYIAYALHMEFKSKFKTANESLISESLEM